MHIHNGNFSLGRLEHDAALAGRSSGIIDRAEEAWFRYDIGRRFFLIPDMVAGRDHRHPGAQQVDGDFWGDAAPVGRVLAVDHDKIDFIVLENLSYHRFCGMPTGLADDITKKKKSNHRSFL